MKKDKKKKVYRRNGMEYLISSLEYELRMIEKVKAKDRKKKIIPKISAY